MSHSDEFLKIYCKEKSFMLHEVQIVLTHKHLTPADINDEIVGYFATYLERCARPKDKKKAPLAYSTARGSLSSFKMRFLHHFKEAPLRAEGPRWSSTLSFLGCGLQTVASWLIVDTPRAARASYPHSLISLSMLTHDVRRTSVTTVLHGSLTLSVAHNIT
jgi:hypothetical protein